MQRQRLYLWRAITPAGELQQGESIGAYRRQVYLRLIAQGYQPLHLRGGRYLNRRYWRTADLIALIKQLAALLQAGLPLLNALTLMAEQHERPGWRCLLRDIARHISQGKSFSETARRYPDVFPEIYPTLFAVGELTGKLDDCCRQLAQQQEQQYRLRQKINQALRYPCFVLGVALLVCAVMLIGVLPAFSQLYAAFDTPLPWFTQRLLGLSARLARHGPLLLSALLLVIAGYGAYRRRYPALRREEQRLLLKMPLLSSLIVGRMLSHVFTLLAMTQRAGLPLPTGLDAAATLRHPLYREALRQIQRQIQQGGSVQQALQRHAALFPAPCPQLVRVGEETGTLDAIFSQLAHWYAQQTLQQAETLTQTLEPALMLIVGGMVGTLVVAMYLPIFQLGSVMAGA